MDKTKFIIPRKIQGFWELMPKEQMFFSSILNKIENVFKANCFLPLDTPVLEHSDVLLAKSGGETDKQIFRFSKGDTDMCMRYDLTVPLARFVAMNKNDLNFPFKRYQIGKVYRGERPQKGRFREFYQCDADIIGDGELSLVADAECVKVLEECFGALNLDVEIKVSNRKILSGFIQALNKEQQSTGLLVVLDKLDKISAENAKQELIKIGLNETECEKLMQLAKTNGTFKDVANKLKNFCSNELFQTGLNELQELDSYLTSLGAKSVKYDLSIIRGHNYYTGTVFEAFLLGSHIAVGGGGRFENLCGYFSDKKMPGVGMSVGVTRLFDILMQQNQIDTSKLNETELAIITFDETLKYGLELMSALRSKGIKANCLYENKSFKSKMKEANRREIKFVLIVGEDEVKSQKFTLKNMQDGSQDQMTLSEIVERIKADRMC